MKKKNALVRIFIWVVVLTMLVPAFHLTTYSNAGINDAVATLDDSGGANGLIHMLDFSDDKGISLKGGAWVENGVIVLPGSTGSYAVVENAKLNDISDSITIFFNARTFSGPSLGTAARTLLAIGAPASGDKEDAALYLHAVGTTNVTAGISNGNTDGRKEVTATGSANVLSNTMWRTFALTYSPADGGTLSLYTQGAMRSTVSNVGIDIKDILSAVGAGYSIGQPLKAASVAYRGSLNNVMIFNYAMSAAEISEMNVRQRMLRDLEYLRLDNEQAYMFNEQGIHNPVTHDVMLYPESRGIGANQYLPISYKSSDPSILTIVSDNNGKNIAAKFHEEKVDNTEDKIVTITATITAPDPNNTGQYLTESKDLQMIIPSWETRRQMDFDAIEIQTPNDVRENVPLFATGKYGSHISWKSSNPAVVTDTPVPNVNDPFPGGGVVTRPGIYDDPVNVKLTATITMDGVPGSLIKEYDLTITPVTEGKGTPSYDNCKYLFTFYAEGYDWDEDGETTEEMYFAISEDAKSWRTLNLKTRDDGTKYTEPIFKSTMGDMGLRDAHFVRSPDGDKFYAMATDLHWSGTYLTRHGFKSSYLSHNNTYDGAAMNRTISIWDARSLTDWGQQRLVRPASYTSGNAFAPESIWDEAKQAHLVYWQQNDKSKLDESGNYISNPNVVGCMYKCYTRDFVTFTEPEYWYGYNEVKDALVYNTTKYVVDTHIAYDKEDGYFYRFASTNRCFVERSKSLDGPWVDLTPIYHGNSNREGSTTFQRPDGGWAMMLDNFSTYVRYDMVKTGSLADLLVGPVASNAAGEALFNEQVYTYPAITLNEGITNQRPTNGVRMKHGMVMQISETEYWQLMAKYGTMDNAALDWVVESINVGPKKIDVSPESKTTFTANVIGQNNPEQTVTWSVEGEVSEGTLIDPETGVLTVASDETAEFLTVRATHTHPYFTTLSGSTIVHVTSTIAEGYVNFYYDEVLAEEIIPGKTLNVKALFTEQITTPQIILVALYDKDGKLISVVTKDTGEIAEDYISFNINLDIPSNVQSGAYVKVFRWNSSNYVPMRKAEVFAKD